MTRNEHYKLALNYAFCMRELNLYLDTHPDDKQAISEFNVCKNEFAKHRDEFVSSGGVWDLTDATDKDTYKWLNDPWPWEYGFYGARGDK